MIPVAWHARLGMRIMLQIVGAIYIHTSGNTYYVRVEYQICVWSYKTNGY